MMDYFERLVNPIQCELKQKVQEEVIHKNSPIRACLGAGGAVVGVLFSNEFRSCYVCQVPVENSGKEVIRKKLESVVGVGAVVHLYSKSISPNGPKTIKNWGSVTFASKHAAQRARDRFSSIYRSPFILRPVTATSVSVQANTAPSSQFFHGKNGPQSNFRMRFFWCRRPADDCGFIELGNKDQLEEAAAMMGDISKCELKGSVHFDVVRVVQSVWCRPFTCEDEEFVERIRTLLEPFHIPVDNGYVVRKRPYATTTKLFDSYNKQFLAHFKRVSPDLLPEAYKLDFHMPKADDNFLQQGTLTLYNLHQAETVAQSLKSFPLFVENELVNFISCSLEVTIYQSLLKVLEDELKVLETVAPRLWPDTTLERVTLKSGRVVARIQSPSPKVTLSLRQRVLDLLNGEVLKDDVLASALCQFQGQHFLETLLKSLKPFLEVHVDRWKGTVTLRGSKSSIERSKMELNVFVRSMGEEQAVIRLRPPEYPSALMKELLRHCHHDLEKLQLKDCAMLKLNCPQRLLVYHGSTAGLAQLKEVLATVSAEIPAVSNANSDSVDCVVCFSPLEGNKWRCLNVCGHYYCTDCINNQLNIALTNREFPIICAADECGQCWAITDIEALLKEGTGTAEDQQGNRGKQKLKPVPINWQPVVEASMTSFLRNNNDYKNCVTPDCVGIYRTTKHMRQFTCEVCRESVCTACNQPYHQGKT